MMPATAPAGPNPPKQKLLNTRTGETLDKYLMRRQTALLRDRQSSDPKWRTLTKFILPYSTQFVTSEKNQIGARENTAVINSTATFSIGTLSAGMMSGVTTASRPWFKLQTGTKALNKVKAVREWLDEVRNLMAELFIKSNLYTTLPVVYEELGTFGTSAFAVMEDLKDADGDMEDGDTIRCYHFPIGSYTLSIGHRGAVNGCYHSFKMTVEQLIHQFGKNNCSINVNNAFNMGQYDQEVEVGHAMEKNPDQDDSKLESRYYPYRSVYFEKAGDPDKYLEIKGTHELCVLAPRWKVNGNDTWGTSPAMTVIGDVKQLQQMEKRKLQSLDMLLDPPRNASAGLRNEYIGRFSGEVTYIPDGVSGVKSEPNYIINPPLQALGMEIQKVEQRIKHGLFEDLFLMISNMEGVQPRNVLEIQARQQEKMMILGPVLERLNDEMLDPLIRRTYSIMLRAGMIPMPPEEMQGQPLVVEYISIMAQAMKLQGVVSVERVIGFVGSMSAQNPQILDKIDFDETVDIYADMVGVPPSMLNDADQVKAIRDARAKQQQTQQALQMAQQGADAAKTMSETQVSTPSMLQQMAGVLQQVGPQAGAA